jgi:hypothetical protein
MDPIETYNLLKKKKDRKYRLINHAAELNKYIIRNANMLPNINTFSKKICKMRCNLFYRFFSGYNHVKLDFKYRDITVFIIPLGFF